MDPAPIVYLVEKDGQDVLCIMQGENFQTFDISPAGLARLAEEVTRQLRKHLNSGSRQPLSL